MMNKWMRCCLGLMFLMGANGFSWAACERELEAYVAANTAFFKEMCQGGRWPSQSDDCTEAGVRTRIYETRSNPYGLSNMNPTQKEQELTRKRQTASNQQKIQGTLQAATNLAETMFNICVLEFGPPDIGKSTRQNQSAQQQAQQSQQQNQSTQQQSQQAQQQAQQAQDAARVAQTRADQARQGKRKTHDPAAEAHQCIEIDKDPGLFGAFKNTCGYKVNFSTCNYRPRVRQGGFNWSADFDCEQQKFGLHTPGGGVAVASHNRNTEMVYWFACKAPALPVDTEFVAGSGVRGRCN